MTKTITLPIPVSANRNWQTNRNGTMRKSSAAKSYQQRAGWIALSQRETYLEDVPVAVEIDVYRQRKKGDLDNYLKTLLDALEGVLYANDNQVVQIIARRFDDAKNPRVEVRVMKLEGE